MTSDELLTFAPWGLESWAVIGTYNEFWDFCVREHSKPMTRVLHFAGTSLGLLLLYGVAKNFSSSPCEAHVGPAFFSPRPKLKPIFKDSNLLKLTATSFRAKYVSYIREFSIGRPANYYHDGPTV